MVICGFLLISVTALCFRAPGLALPLTYTMLPRPCGEIHPQCWAVNLSVAAHLGSTSSLWHCWEALECIWVPFTWWGVLCAPQLGSGALGHQQWGPGELMLLCESVAHRARGSPRALQALMNVTTNVIYSAIHYWYWRDCILILSFAVKINTLHAGYKSVFAFNCKSE